METAPQVDPSRRISKCSLAPPKARAPTSARQGSPAEQQHLDWLRWPVGMGQEHTGGPNGERITVGGHSPLRRSANQGGSPPREGRGASIFIPPRFGDSWGEGPRRRSLSQASASAATLPDFTAAQGPRGPFRSGRRRPRRSPRSRRSKRSLLPRYAAICTRSPERACAGPAPSRRAGVEDQFIGRHALDFAEPFMSFSWPVEVVPPCRETSRGRCRSPPASAFGRPRRGVRGVRGCQTDVALQHGHLLLDLEEQGIIPVTPFEQHHACPAPRCRPDLPRRIHEAEPVEQVATVFLRGALVALQIA